MADKEVGDKSKDKESSNVTPPFSENQVAFLRTLLEERVPPPPSSGKDKEPAKKPTNRTKKPTNEAEYSGENVAWEYEGNRIQRGRLFATRDGGAMYRDITRKKWGLKDFRTHKKAAETASEGGVRSKVSVEH